MQAARTGGRKLFNKARKRTFLGWFAATANLGWAAEKAGVCRQTVSKHLMSDPEFRGDYAEALEVSRLRLSAKVLETRKPEAAAGPEDGEIEAPDIDLPFDKALAVLREMEREVKTGRKQGRTPRIASNAEVTEALTKRVKALWRRVQQREGVERGEGDGGAVGPLHQPSPSATDGSPPRAGEDLG